MIKNKTKILIYVVTAGLLFFNVAKAQFVTNIDPFYDFKYYMFALADLVGIFTGYFLLFRNFRSMLAVFLANLISYPLFIIFLNYTLGYLGNYYFKLFVYYNYIVCLDTFIGVSLVILFDAWFIKKIFKSQLTWKRALATSAALNTMALIFEIIFYTLLFFYLTPTYNFVNF